MFNLIILSFIQNYYISNTSMISFSVSVSVSVSVTPFAVEEYITLGDLLSHFYLLNYLFYFLIFLFLHIF